MSKNEWKLPFTSSSMAKFAENNPVYRLVYNNIKPDWNLLHYKTQKSKPIAVDIRDVTGLDALLKNMTDKTAKQEKIVKKLTSYGEKLHKEEFRFEETGKEKLIKSFFRVCIIEKKNELFAIINQFDDDEFLFLLDILKSIEFLHVFVASTAIQKSIKNIILAHSKNYSEKNLSVLFYKKYFELDLSIKEIDFANKVLQKLRDKCTPIRRIYKSHIDFAFTAYVLDEFSFEMLLKQNEKCPSRFYNELMLYTALVQSFILLLDKKTRIEEIARDYVRYINFYYQGSSPNVNYLKVEISNLWATIFANSNITQMSSLYIRDLLVRQENRIDLFSFYLQLYETNLSMFINLVNETELQEFENILTSNDGRFQVHVDTCFSLSKLFAEINIKKSLYYLEKGISDGILRHGWRKDTIISHHLVDALEVLWMNNYKSKDILTSYSDQVFLLTLRALNISDGDHTMYGPYFMIDLIAKYDINLAEKYLTQLKKSDRCYDFINASITSILIGKVKRGYPLDGIEKQMASYQEKFFSPGKPQAEHYEQNFRVFLAIAQSNLYSNTECNDAFDSAYVQCTQVKEKNIDFFLDDREFGDEIVQFKSLCDRHKKDFPLKFDVKNQTQDVSTNVEDTFILDIKKSDNRHQIKKLYKKLNVHENPIILSRCNSWECLVRQTFKICKNIDLFLDLLSKSRFPSYDFITVNSKYLHFGLAAALKFPDTKQEILKYLYSNTGHQGFLNVMKAYETLKDKEKCLLLFERFLKFCELLVN